jgi:hypothetical protein
MERRTRALTSFVAVVTFIIAAAFASIYVEGREPRFVGPVAAVAVAASVMVFTSRFNASRKDDSITRPAETPAVPDSFPSRAPGITFLRVVTIATLCVGAIMIVTFAIEASTGTLNTDDVRRFVPKAAFALALAGYVFHKTGKSPS